MNIQQRNCFNKEINKLEKKNFITTIDGRIVLTEKGMLLADSITENLFII